MPPTPTLMSPVLAVAMSHPTRVGALSILLERAATPKEIATELEERASNVGYHLKVLVGLGCIELISAEPAGGGRVVEHTYQAVERAYFDAGAWDQLGSSEKLDIAVTLMRVISDEISVAMSQGTFFDPDDNHISRSPMRTDMEGWEEVTAFLDGTLNGLFEIQDRIDERCANDEERETFPIKVEIIQFRSPEKGKQAQPK